MVKLILNNFFKYFRYYWDYRYWPIGLLGSDLIPFLWMLLKKHPLCHRMFKVTKETSGANKIMRNTIDSMSITFRWTLSSSRQSVFSTTTIAKKTEENGSQSRKSDYLVKIGPCTSEPLLEIKTVIWDQLLATKAEIIQS